MRYALMLLLLALPVWPAGATEWSGPVGPSATVWMAFDDGLLTIRFEERWTEQPRVSTALASYSWNGELLELEVKNVRFEGFGAQTRRPEEGFVIETPRKGVLDNPTPTLILRPGAYLRLNALEDDNLLEVRGNGGFELTLYR